MIRLEQTTARSRRSSPRERLDRALAAAPREDALVRTRGGADAGAPDVPGRSRAGDFVCRSVLRHREEGVALKQQAVLFRAAHHSDLLEVELARRNIPFVKYGGLKFLEAAHVKDALSLLRVLENPFDEVSWFRVLQLPEGVGPATARRLMDELGVRRIDDDQPSPLLRFLEEPVGCPRPRWAARRSCAPRSATAWWTRARAAGRAARRIRAFWSRCSRAAHAAASRTRDLEQLELLASGHESADGSSPSSRWTHPRPRVTWRGPRSWTRTGSCSPRSIRPRAGVGRRPRDPRRRRHDPVGHGDRGRRRDRGGAAAALRGDDPRAGRVVRLVPAAVLPPAARPGGSHSYAQLTRFLPEEVRSNFDEIGSDVVPLPDADAIDGTADVDAFLAGLWAE